MPDDVSGGRSCPHRRPRPLPLTGTAVAAVTVCAGLALAVTSASLRGGLAGG